MKIWQFLKSMVWLGDIGNIDVCHAVLVIVVVIGFVHGKAAFEFP